MNQFPPQQPTEPVNLDVTDPGRRFFWPVAVAGSLFCLSLLIWIAAGFGDPAAPVNAWINRHGTTVILVETAFVVVASVLAMTLDRRATLATQERQKDRSSANSATPESDWANWEVRSRCTQFSG